MTDKENISFLGGVLSTIGFARDVKFSIWNRRWVCINVYRYDLFPFGLNQNEITSKFQSLELMVIRQVVIKSITQNNRRM
jgi:hypothetical protein